MERAERGEGEREEGLRTREIEMCILFELWLICFHITHRKQLAICISPSSLRPKLKPIFLAISHVTAIPVLSFALLQLRKGNKEGGGKNK